MSMIVTVCDQVYAAILLEYLGPIGRHPRPLYAVTAADYEKAKSACATYLYRFGRYAPEVRYEDDHATVELGDNGHIEFLPVGDGRWVQEKHPDVVIVIDPDAIPKKTMRTMGWHTYREWCEERTGCAKVAID